MMNSEGGSCQKHCSPNYHKMSPYFNSKPRKYYNFFHLLKNRELQESNWRLFSKKAQIFNSAVERLDVIEELNGHCGCVNCLEFNENGNLLLSGSDDFNIILWDVYRRKLLKSISTGHRGNIFSVKFLPQTNDNLIVSGAGDHRLEVREINTGEVTQACTCHSERVKRIATVPTAPNLFFSSSEDGTVMQFDTRMKHACSSQPNNVLVNLKQYAGRLAECKCVTVHPLRSEFVAVGANDPYIRVYDRRMINLTNIQYPPGGSRTSWDPRNYASSQVDTSSDNLPPGCVQFYVPGHLPAKMKDYHRKYRSLATTYLAYSTDGVYLLANLGGDHIYLFDTLQAEVPREYTTPIKHNSRPQKACLVAHPNGVCKIMEPTNGYSSHSTPSEEDDILQPLPIPMPSCIVAIRNKAHKAFNAQDYTTALELYNRGIQMYDNIALLYSARAATLIKRKWDGDIYAALRDCNKALELDPNNIKAKFRQVRCLRLLGREDETQQCLRDLLDQYPQLSTSSSLIELKDKIANSPYHSNSGILQSYVSQARTTSPSASLETSRDLVHTSAPVDRQMRWGSDSYEQSTSVLAVFRWGRREMEGRPGDAEFLSSGSDCDKDDEGFIIPPISSKEKCWRGLAKDYDKVFSGHCNTTTDIKEAVFLGQNSDYIAAGSDDGNLFIWDLHTTNLVRVIEADKSIVNCVQSHPNVCMLATSGIETVVKLWGPIGEGITNADFTSGEKLLKITRENQQRMSTDPMEMMFLQMGEFGEAGFFGRRRMDPNSEFENAFFNGQSNVQCRQA